MKNLGKHENARFGASAAAAVLPRLGEISSPTLRTAGMAAVYFILALFLARGTVAGVLAPFGVGFTAAVSCRRAPSKLYAFLAFAGASLGYALANGAADGLRYVLVCALCFASGLVFRDLPARRLGWFPPLIAASALTATAVVWFSAYGLQLRQCALFVCDASLAALSACCYGPALARISRAREAKTERPPNIAAQGAAKDAVCLAAAGLSLLPPLCALPQLFGMSAGRFAAILAALCAAGTSPIFGCACGLLCGLAVGASLGNAAAMALGYALSGLAAGFLRRRGTFWTALVFTLCHAALMPWLWGALPLYPFFECFAAGVVYYLFAPRLRAAADRLIEPLEKARDSAREQRFAATVRGRLRAAARAFAAVCTQSAQPEETPEENKDTLYTLALDRVCRACPLSAQCFKLSGELTRQSLEEARSRILAEGRAKPEFFPPFFAARCQKLEEFTGAVNEHLALRESRARYRRRAKDDARLLSAQYGAIGELFEELSGAFAGQSADCTAENRALRRALAKNDIALKLTLARENGRYACTVDTRAPLPAALRRTLEELVGQTVGRTMRFARADSPGAAPRMREEKALVLRAAVSAQTMDGEEDSGDNAVWLRTAAGADYFVLADGMGSGPEASGASADFIAMLEGFLQAGAAPETALRLIHPAYTIRCGGDSFTTCDILRVDLYTGQAATYKCGAAPTYLCRSGSMPRKICSVSLPVGLPAETPRADRTQFLLRPGDTVLMLSDGLCAEDDRWLLSLLAENRTLSAQALAALVMERGKTLLGLQDDCTVLAVRVFGPEKTGHV